MRNFERFARGFIDRGPMLDRATNAMERTYYGHDGRVAHKWHHYLEIYDRHLGRYVGRPVRMLEIGVFRGGSLQIWKKYLGDQAVIHGIDVDPACAQYSGDGIAVHIGNQADVKFINDVVDQMGGVDVIIDDGGHIGSHQIVTFQALYPRLSHDGVYICEDTHTAYWRKFGGGFRQPGGFIEYTKGLIDMLHAWYVEDPGVSLEEFFARMTLGISIYDSMIVFERKTKEEPFHCLVGTQ